MSRRRKTIWIIAVLLSIGGGIGGYCWHRQATEVERRVRDLVYEAAGWPDSPIEARLKNWHLSFLLKNKPPVRQMKEIENDLFTIGKPAIPELLSLLDDKNEKVRDATLDIVIFLRREVVYPVGQRGNPPNESDSRVIETFLDSRAYAPLVRLLLHDPSDWIRRNAARGLCQLHDFRAIEPLIYAMQNDPDGFVRADAISVLGDFQNPRGVEPLIKQLNKDAIANLQENINRSKASYRFSYDPANFLEYTVTIKENIRAVAAASLGEIRNPRAVDPLVNSLENDDCACVRVLSARALGLLRDARAVEPLIRTMGTSDDSGVRCESAKALGEIGDTRAFEPLIEMLKKCLDPAAPAKRTAKPDELTVAVVSAIKELRDPRTIESLELILKGKSSKYEDGRYVRGEMEKMSHQTFTNRLSTGCPQATRPAVSMPD